MAAIEEGPGKETSSPFYRFIGEMWQALGSPLDGRDTDVPWSAAAISFMVRKAARRFPSYGSFRFAAAHSRYIHDSITKHNQNNASTPFLGLPPARAAARAR